MRKCFITLTVNTICLIQMVSTFSTVNLICKHSNYSLSCEAPSNFQVINKFTKISMKSPDTRMIELSISNVIVFHLPTNIADYFPNLTRLDVVRSSLTEIHQRDLKYLNVLTSVDLSQNVLKVLEKDLFKFNNRLIKIHLQGNLIKKIDPNIFDNLINLQDLRLENNICIQEDHRHLSLILEKVEKNCGMTMKSDLISTVGLQKEIVFFFLGGVIAAIFISIVVRIKINKWNYMVTKRRKDIEFIDGYNSVGVEHFGAVLSKV